ncbi:MAG TPA: ECF RNA polymerase sigma factor SigK [Kineosporiaceae bacterium]
MSSQEDPGAPGQRVQPLDVEGQLLVQVAGGDVAAFDELYARCSPVVYGIVLQVLRDPSQAEEVAQEVLVEAWRTAARFDVRRGSARSWLLTMARRRAIDRVRAAQAAADRDVRAGIAATVPDFDEVTEQVWNRLEHEQVRRCLDGLTALQRQAIELAFYRGHSHREVSDVLRVPLGTVKTRLRDGLIRLRDCVGVQA